jgi:hypothetical protein
MVAAPAFGVATMCAVSHVRPMPTDPEGGGAAGADLPIRYMGCVSESRPIDLIRLRNSSGELMRPDCDYRRLRSPPWRDRSLHGFELHAESERSQPQGH